MNLNKLKILFRQRLHKIKEDIRYNQYVRFKFKDNPKLIEYFLKK